MPTRMRPAATDPDALPKRRSIVVFTKPYYPDSLDHARSATAGLQEFAEGADRRKTITLRLYQNVDYGADADRQRARGNAGRR